MKPMQNNGIKFFILNSAFCILISAGFVKFVFADNAVLTIPGEARGAALGEAYSASASGAESIWYNPAALARREAPSLSLMHTAYLESVTLNTVASAIPIGNKNAAGFGFSYLNAGSITGYDNTGASASSYAPKDMCARFGVARAFYKTGVGLCAYFLRSTITETASTVGLNAGLHQTVGPFSLALVGENFGGKLKYRSEEAALPQRLKAGLNIQLLPVVSWSAEMFRPKSGSTYFGTGFEYLLNNAGWYGFMLRAGYNTRAVGDIHGLHGLSGGVGLSMKGSELNYAWVPFGDLGNTHRVSFDVEIGGDNVSPRTDVTTPSQVLIKPSERINRVRIAPENTPRAAISLPFFPWKRYRGGERTSKERVMSLLAKDALCSEISPNALVTKAVGVIELKSDGEVRRAHRLRTGQYLFAGDKIRTHANAHAHLVFVNGAMVEVGPNTNFAVEPNQEFCKQALISLNQGRVFAAAGSGKSIEITSQGGSRQIDGTEEWITYEGGKLTAETPRSPVRVTEPAHRKIPGRWDTQFSNKFETEMMRLDSVPGLVLAEYIRDTALRNKLHLQVAYERGRLREMNAQVSNFSADIEGFMQLKAALEKRPDNESEEQRKKREKELKSILAALKNAQKTLKPLRKELSALVKSVRENQEYLAAIPIIRMLNVTAQESTVPFESGRAAVPDQARDVLNAIAESIVQLQPYRVVVEGHTDKLGSSRVNIRLSKQRAEMIAQYLRMKTKTSARLFVTKGMGAAQPRESGDDPESMAKNRRVEIWFELRGL